MDLHGNRIEDCEQNCQQQSKNDRYVVSISDVCVPFVVEPMGYHRMAHQVLSAIAKHPGQHMVHLPCMVHLPLEVHVWLKPAIITEYFLICILYWGQTFGRFRGFI